MRIGLLEKKLEGGGGQIDPPLPCDRWENCPPEEGLTVVENNDLTQKCSHQD